MMRQPEKPTAKWKPGNKNSCVLKIANSRYQIKKVRSGTLGPAKACTQATENNWTRISEKNFLVPNWVAYAQCKHQAKLDKHIKS